MLARSWPAAGLGERTLVLYSSSWSAESVSMSSAVREKANEPTGRAPSAGAWNSDGVE